MKAVIVGSGALGLGFLVERMAEDYDLCLVDVSAKAPDLDAIRAHQAYTANICSRDGVESKVVAGRYDIAYSDMSSGREKFYHALRTYDLVLTVTGRGILGTLVPEIAPVMNARTQTAWLLFCENGLGIAASFAKSFGPHVVLVDTVMSRMCRFAGLNEPEYRPLHTGPDKSLVVEEYHHLPLDADLCASGPFSSVFSMVSHEEFRCWEDIKIYMHNGVHAFISYRAFLQGVKYFSDTPEPIRRDARRVILDELVPAIAKTHSCASLQDVRRYGLDLLERIFNPHFRDAIKRGIRGIEQKLAPNERLYGGCDFIRRAGVEPTLYAGTTAVAKQILQMKAAKG